MPLRFQLQTAWGWCAALFLARCDVRGVSELICVELFLWVLKPFLTVSRYACMETEASQDSTEREGKGEQPEFGGCWLRVQS